MASAAFDKYPSDFENATDEDIGSFLEEMSKIAGALSPNSAPERTKSGDSTKNPTEEEKSVEELLEEAEKLVKKNVCLSKSASRSDTLVPEDSPKENNNSNRVFNLEDDIFQLIEEEVHRETEKIRKSPKNEQKRIPTPDFELIYENVNNLKPPRSLELQKKRFDEQKVEVSSSSDLDDPIERHSQSEDLKIAKKTAEDKESLRKEITDVDKDFFDDLLRKSKEKAEGKISTSSSFGQEDFSHFLKILQHQSDPKSKDLNLKNNNSFDLMVNLPNDPKTATFPEKEITEILERELQKVKNPKNNHEIIDSESSVVRERSRTFSRQSSVDKTRKIDKNHQQNELYAVGLTPRLELFADAIPKLIAEKSNEIPQQPDAYSPENVEKSNVISNRDTFTIIPSHSVAKNAQKIVKSAVLNPSRSFDQLSKPVTSFKSSLDDIRPTKSSETLRKVAKNPKPKPSMTSYGSKIKFSVKPTAQKPPKPSNPVKKTAESIIKNSLAGGDSKKHFSKDDWELLCHEEKHKNALLKDQIEAEASLYKQQISSMRTSFEEELFALKKQNIILKAKIDEFSLVERREKRIEVPASKAETQVLLLEKELEKQESLIRTYESENKRLISESKRATDELKQLELKKSMKEVATNINETSKLNDIIKDLREEILKLNFEVSDLRQKSSDAAMKTDDMFQQNSLLEEELSMFKDQLKTKDRFITEKLQSLNQQEVETKRKMEEMRIELNSKTEKLKITRSEFDQFQQAILPLEKELLELRVREQNLQDKLVVSKSHVEREKVLTIKLKDQVILDNKKILDLNRQVREMERILKRKNPDSVSALILTAKSDHERLNLEKIKLLEDRIASLEGENKAKEQIGQEKLTELQEKFAEMKKKYAGQVLELEQKLTEATKKDRIIYSDMFTQTIVKNVENKSVETKREEKIISNDREIKTAIKVGPKSQNTKEDTHLIATIRGLKLELVNKDKALAKLTKELQELQKTNRRLQKEREKLLNDRRNLKPVECDKGNRQLTKTTETNDQNSNVYQNGHLSNGTKLSGSSQRLYDPLHYSENGDSGTARRLHDENEILKEELNKMNKDFMTLKTKRLHDLNLLQEEHEREVAALVKEYSVKFGDSKVVKLQVCVAIFLFLFFF